MCLFFTHTHTHSLARTGPLVSERTCMLLKRCSTCFSHKRMRRVSVYAFARDVCALYLADFYTSSFRLVPKEEKNPQSTETKPAAVAAVIASPACEQRRAAAMRPLSASAYYVRFSGFLCSLYILLYHYYRSPDFFSYFSFRHTRSVRLCVRLSIVWMVRVYRKSKRSTRSSAWWYTLNGTTGFRPTKLDRLQCDHRVHDHQTATLFTSLATLAAVSPFFTFTKDTVFSRVRFSFALTCMVLSWIFVRTHLYNVLSFFNSTPARYVKLLE